ncbi:MAG TPA: hypothetical protein VMT94_04965 [Burkholderiales bacterium]|nr:hypothetical protein [Burkholderiales bacterium]
MAEKLIIPISEMESSAEMVYVGDRARPSSATSVYLLDPNTFVCCHYDGCKILLVRFDLNGGSYRFLQCSDTVSNREKVQTDLLAGDGNGNLVVSNGHQQTCTLYRYENERIRFVKDLGPKLGDFAHGIKFYTPDIVAVTSRGDCGGTYFIDHRTGEIVYKLPAPGVSVQDLCFLSENRAAVLYTVGSPSYDPGEIYPSFLQIVDFRIGGNGAQVLRERYFEDAHIDCITSYGNRLYFTDQYNNKVIVCDPQNLDLLEEIGGYDFPHGIDVRYDILAVTNYGSNTVELRTLGA